MLVYWLMFAWPAGATFLWSGNEYRRAIRAALVVLFLVFCVVVGLRDETGGDWINYADYTEAVSFVSLETAFTANNEPGFALITWLSTRIGLGVYGPSAFCAIILMWAIVRFARRQPDSWLAITASVPYLIIVVGMGYVRQSAAIGFIMIALLNFESGRTIRCLIYLLLASLFHTSALFVFPFIALALSRRNIVFAIPLSILSIPVIYMIIGNRLDQMMQNYVEAKLDSSGTLVRLLMNAVPSMIFMIYRDKFHLSNEMKFIWTMFAVTSCLLIMIFPLSPSSTLVDRLGLYMIPIQLMVFGHLSSVMAKKPQEGGLINLFAVLYFAVVQYVWFNYAKSVFAWVPYHSLLTS